VPGIGDVTTLALIAELACMPDDLGPKQLTAMAGLDPQPHQSGTMDAQRRISRKGNERLRTTLYIAAWNASNYSPNVKAYRDALVERGKASNVAYIAVARRLLMGPTRDWAVRS
jgi:transposase